MEILQLIPLCMPPVNLTNSFNKTQLSLRIPENSKPCRARTIAVRAVSETQSKAVVPEEPPSIDCAFVEPTLLPDGSPDIHIRSAIGGQKLRNIMLDTNIDLYGPAEKPLLNCAGVGTCRTCIVEVVAGKELLSPRTDKEKEAFKKKPKTWRLACQTVVGKEDSRGQLVIQTLPEWKSHEWD